MYNFICCLLSNLALLAAVKLVCWFIRAMRPDLTLDATRVFIGMIAIAGVFDAALTFLVFADAGGPWAAYHPVSAFYARALAYGLSMAIALWLARRAARAAARQERSGANGTGATGVARGSGKDGALVIETSPYSKSTLPM